MELGKQFSPDLFTYDNLELRLILVSVLFLSCVTRVYFSLIDSSSSC